MLSLHCVTALLYSDALFIAPHTTDKRSSVLHYYYTVEITISYVQYSTLTSLALHYCTVLHYYCTVVHILHYCGIVYVSALHKYTTLGTCGIYPLP